MAESARIPRAAVVIRIGACYTQPAAPTPKKASGLRPTLSAKHRARQLPAQAGAAGLYCPPDMDGTHGPRLIVTDTLGRRIVSIDKPLFTMGRRSETDLRLSGTDISRV